MDGIIKSILILREKYFGRNSQANMYEHRVLDEVVINFYKSETNKIDRRKENRVPEKALILEKLNQTIKGIELPQYQSKEYSLHLYFYQFPNVPGSLYIKANGIEYECRNYTRNRYVVIDSVRTDILIEFVNNKSDEFTAKLVCMQGVGRYELELKSAKDN